MQYKMLQTNLSIDNSINRSNNLSNLLKESERSCSQTQNANKVSSFLKHCNVFDFSLEDFKDTVTICACAHMHKSAHSCSQEK